MQGFSRLAASRFEFEEEPHWLAAVVAPRFSELALESLTDGCLGEGVAARILASAADESQDAELAAELREVAPWVRASGARRLKM